MLERLIPHNYNHKAFYIDACDNLRFRVYKVESFYSTVGAAWVVMFHVSYRDLQKLKKFQYKYDDKTFCIADIPEMDVKRILLQLKEYGECNIESL